MPRFSNRPFLATTLSFLSSRGAADSLRRVGREMTKLVPSAAAKGASGLAFETWDPSNQFPLETPILLFVIRSVPGFPTSPLSPTATYVVLPKENHMKLTEAATLDRKSGGAEGPAVPRTFLGNVFFERAQRFSFPR